MVVAYLKKFPHGVPETFRSQEWDRQLEKHVPLTTAITRVHGGKKEVAETHAHTEIFMHKLL